MIVIADLKKGMYLTNNGKTVIPLYDENDGTGPVLISIRPGELIGQVMDFRTGPKGNVILFSSDAITANTGLAQRALVYMLTWVPDRFYNVASANFADIQNNVSVQSVSEQNAAIANANANGVSLTNSIKSVAKGAGEALGEVGTSLIPWNLVLIAAGGYVVINWNKYFKPINIKK